MDFLSADELENLTIRAGTLTAAERQIINHHIDVTIQMLEALPWPKHLTNVPEYAGGHHERMDGKGYPRGLTREQMSVQARCMGIADIFEALTAKDRPYKKGKTLSEALTILGKFKLNGHIDPDLFDVFMWEKVYLKYAQRVHDRRPDRRRRSHVGSRATSRPRRASPALQSLPREIDDQPLGGGLDEHFAVASLLAAPIGTCCPTGLSCTRRACARS